MFSRNLIQSRYSRNVFCIFKKYTLGEEWIQALSYNPRNVSAGVAGELLKALDALQHSQVLGAVVRPCPEIKNAEQAPACPVD